MSFDFTTLITDRTQADVDRVKAIAKKIKNGTASESELAEFNSAAMKGAYNYTDLNRVTAAMEALKAKLEGYGYAVPGYQRIKVPHPEEVRLPEGYTELAWIESSGTQYVDTEFKPNQDSRLIIDIDVATGASSGALFASRESNMTNYFGVFLVGESSVRSDYGTNLVTMDSVTIPGRGILDKNKNILTFKGESATNQTAVFSGTQSIYLLTVNTGGVAGAERVSAKIYSCQIYDDDTLVRNYIPCITPEGGVGLYDRVTKSFFGNSGTGVFIAGDAIRVYEEFDPYLWYEVDWPTETTMITYLGNIAAIRSVLAVLTTTPVVPADMVGLMAKEANNIETILMDVSRQLAILPTTFIPSGEALSGGDNL